MTLSKEDKKILESWGHPKSDFRQIEIALNKTVYILESDNNRRISAKEARNLLDTETFLSGISRSAFHWTCSRENNGNVVHFDSSRIFR